MYPSWKVEMHSLTMYLCTCLQVCYTASGLICALPFLFLVFLVPWIQCPFCTHGEFVVVGDTDVSVIWADLADRSNAYSQTGPRTYSLWSGTLNSISHQQWKSRHPKQWYHINALPDLAPGCKGILSRMQSANISSCSFAIVMSVQVAVYTD